MVFVNKNPPPLAFFHSLPPVSMLIDTVPRKSRGCGPGLPAGLLQPNAEDEGMLQPSCLNRQNRDFPEG